MSEERHVQTYIMLSRKLITTWLVVTIVLFIGILTSFQYTNYVDRKSNSQLCGMVTIFYEATRASPENTEIVKRALMEFGKLQKLYKCT